MRDCIVSRSEGYKAMRRAESDNKDNGRSRVVALFDKEGDVVKLRSGEAVKIPPSSIMYVTEGSAVWYIK